MYIIPAGKRPYTFRLSHFSYRGGAGTSRTSAPLGQTIVSLWLRTGILLQFWDGSKPHPRLLRIYREV